MLMIVNCFTPQTISRIMKRFLTEILYSTHIHYNGILFHRGETRLPSLVEKGSINYKKLKRSPSYRKNIYISFFNSLCFRLLFLYILTLGWNYVSVTSNSIWEDTHLDLKFSLWQLQYIISWWIFVLFCCLYIILHTAIFDVTHVHGKSDSFIP